MRYVSWVVQPCAVYHCGQRRGKHTLGWDRCTNLVAQSFGQFEDSNSSIYRVDVATLSRALDNEVLVARRMPSTLVLILTSTMHI